MDRNFIENCKLLKQHFTKLTQADTTAQSKHDNIIDEAKKLLLSEQTEGLSDTDIKQIKENSLEKYAKDLQKYGYKQNPRICQKNDIKWNDEIFVPLPHPSNNSEYLKTHKTNLVPQNDFTEIIFAKFDDLQNKCKIERETITEIPELKITPQKNEKIFLEIKKISMEGKDSTDNYDLTDNKVLSVQNKKHITHVQNKKIDNFLNNLQKFKLNKTNRSKSDLATNTKIIATKIKPKSSNSDTKITSFEHRFKAQKDIIDMQKQKLEEQNRLIEELKLNRIDKEARESYEKAKEVQKTILLASKQKYKVKAENNQNKTENTNNELNFALNSNKAPKIVKMMEERAKERQEKRLIIQERKRIIEEDKKRQAEELVQRKVKEETEEKKVRIERMKRQRELIRKMELRKQAKKKRYIELNEVANAHYKTTLKKLGFHKLKMLIYESKINFEIAKRFYENNIVLNCFKSWRSYTLKIIEKKNKFAAELYQKRLLTAALESWKTSHFKTVRSKQVAEDYYEISLQSKCFIAWHKLICEYRVQFVINAKKADNYYRRILLFNCLANWRSLPEIMKIEKIQNERKRKWRLRVAEILSDYDPLKNYEY